MPAFIASSGQSFGFAPLRKAAMSSPFFCQLVMAVSVPVLSAACAAVTRATAPRI